MGCGKESPEGGDMCILMAESHCCMAEANTILYGNYLPIKKKFNKLNAVNDSLKYRYI